MAPAASLPEPANDAASAPDAFGAIPHAPWPEDATRDAFCGDWFLWQRRRGHRTSTDDMLTAWLATRVSHTPPERYLDLGCGIGSVLLLTAHALRPGWSIGVEAQAQSARMAARTIDELPMSAPTLHVRQADIRALDPARTGRFPLITGSPPYLPEGSGVQSPDPQRAACRFELRGGIEDYCHTAAALLAPGGHFVVVFQSTWHDRVISAATQAGLSPRQQVDLFTRSDRPEDFLKVYALSNQPGPTQRRTLCVRQPDGSLTQDWKTVRMDLYLGGVPDPPN